MPKTGPAPRTCATRPGVGGIPQRRHGMCLSAQPLEIVHEPVARVLRVLVMHPDVDRLLGAHLLAVAAEDAAELVDLVDQRIAVAVFVLSRHELDAVRRADLGTQAAGDTLGAPLLVGEHAVRPAPARGEGPVLAALLLRVLHRHLRSPQVAERERHALERRAQVGGLIAGALHHLDADRHQAGSSATAPAIRWPRSSPKNSGTASSTFRANSTSPKRVS